MLLVWDVNLYKCIPNKEFLYYKLKHCFEIESWWIRHSKYPKVFECLRPVNRWIENASQINDKTLSSNLFFEGWNSDDISHEMKTIPGELWQFHDLESIFTLIFSSCAYWPGDSALEIITQLSTFLHDYLQHRFEKLFPTSAP